MNYYTDLKVWQKAMDLVEIVYKLVKYLPKEDTTAYLCPFEIFK